MRAKIKQFFYTVLSLSKEFGNIDGFKIFKTIVTYLTILLQWIRIVLIKMEIAVPCAFQRLLDISAHVQMEWIWKTNLRVHKVKYTLAIANLTNYTFNWFEFFLKKTVIFIFIEKIWTCFKKKCVYSKLQFKKTNKQNFFDVHLRY